MTPESTNLKPEKTDNRCKKADFGLECERVDLRPERADHGFNRVDLRCEGDELIT